MTPKSAWLNTNLPKFFLLWWRKGLFVYCHCMSRFDEAITPLLVEAKAHSRVTILPSKEQLFHGDASFSATAVRASRRGTTCHLDTVCHSKGKMADRFLVVHLQPGAQAAASRALP